MNLELIQGDCRARLKEIPDRSIDLAILDPPYWKVTSQKWDYGWRTQEDYWDWCYEWLQEVIRTLKYSASLFLFGYFRNLIGLYQPIESLGLSFRQQITLDKGLRSLGGRATKNYKLFANTTEDLWFFVYNSRPFVRNFLKKRQQTLEISAKDINKQLGVKTNGGGMWSLYTGDNISGQIPTRENWEKLKIILDFDLPYDEISPTFQPEMGITNIWRDIDFYSEKRYHPTQKPIEAIERIIRATTRPGDTILDPFLGSGTTALACRNLGRNCIGIEKDADYLNKAYQRLQQPHLVGFT